MFKKLIALLLLGGLAANAKTYPGEEQITRISGGAVAGTSLFLESITLLANTTPSQARSNLQHLYKKAHYSDKNTHMVSFAYSPGQIGPI